MKKIIIAFTLLVATLAFAAPGDRPIHVNPNQDGDSYIQINKGGVATKALEIVGSTGKVKIGADGFDDTGGGAATSASMGLVSRENDIAEGDLGTISLTGTWSTIDSKKYKCIQVGKRVDLWFRLESTTTSSSLSGLSFELPAACPPIAYFSTNAGAEWNAGGSGFVAVTPGGTPVISVVANYNSTPNIYMYFASGGYRIAVGHITYWTN